MYTYAPISPHPIMTGPVISVGFVACTSSGLVGRTALVIMERVITDVECRAAHTERVRRTLDIDALSADLR